MVKEISHWSYATSIRKTVRRRLKPLVPLYTLEKRPLIGRLLLAGGYCAFANGEAKLPLTTAAMVGPDERGGAYSGDEIQDWWRLWSL